MKTSRKWDMLIYNKTINDYFEHINYLLVHKDTI